MTRTIAVLPGDGIGPEVTAQAVRVLRAVAEAFGHDFALVEAPVGGTAIDLTGSPLPDETLACVSGADAVLLGAVGGPRWDDPSAPVRPEQGLLALRRTLGLFANVRPIRLHPRTSAASPLRAERLRGVDFVFVRELTGGIYFGEKRRDADTAVDVCTYSVHEVERVARFAAALARQRRSRLTSVDKANVLETSRLWRSVVTRVVTTEFPDVALEHVLVDACAMHLIREPARFDVIVTENMFGDILTDEASVLAGSIGLLPSASLGDTLNAAGAPVGLYEPIHGSAPDIAGQGVANPIGAILSAALLLRHSFGLEREAAAIETAVRAVLAECIVTPDLAACTAQPADTGMVADAVLAALPLPEPAPRPLEAVHD